MKKTHKIKLRFLDKKAWYDCDTVLEHSSFEILCRFIEDECSPGMVCWDNVYHEINGKKVHVITELKKIREWWIKRNSKPDPYEELLNIVMKIQKNLRKKYDVKQFDSKPIGNGIHRIVFPDEGMNEADKKTYNRCFKAILRMDELDEKRIEKNLIILAKLRKYMWT